MSYISITGISALQFWLNGNNDTDPYCYDHRVLSSLPHKWFFQDDIDIAETIADKYGISLPLIIQSTDIKVRIRQKKIRSSLLSSHIPKNSFICIDQLSGNIPVYIACPEYCFLNAASHLSFLELIQLGYTLCSGYVQADNQYGQRSRCPLTCVQSVSDYLNRCSGFPGIKNARRALQYIKDGSNSPMETKISMALTLPVSSGGFGMPGHQLNKPAQLSSKGYEYLGYECICDFLWTERKIVVEYDSKLTHLSPDQHARDKRRLTALTISGYKVFTITSDFLRNFSTFQQTFFQLRHMLKMKPLKKKFQTYLDQRYELFRFLLGH